MNKVLYSAVKPTGRLTLGNYLGAVDNWLSMQKDYQSIFCIADLHSLTIEINPEELLDNSISAMAFYLACGLDPKQSNLYFQSQIKEHTELCWLLNANTYVGEANRMTAYKEKAQKGKNVSVALYDYPVLMAADILLYNTSYVPIGEDQRQHMELATTLATRFNNKYKNELFVVPEGVYPKIGAKIYDLQEPNKKMSKSDPTGIGCIYLEDSPDDIWDKIKRAVTDSDNKITASNDKPGISNLLNIYCVCTGQSIVQAEQHFSGLGYGQLKRQVADAIIARLEPMQMEYNRIRKDINYIKEVAESGANNLRPIAEEKVKKAKELMGLLF